MTASVTITRPAEDPAQHEVEVVVREEGSRPSERVLQLLKPGEAVQVYVWRGHEVIVREKSK